MEQHITIIHEKRTPHSQTDRSKDVVDRWGMVVGVINGPVWWILLQSTVVSLWPELIFQFFNLTLMLFLGTVVHLTQYF